MCDQTEVLYLPGDVVWVKLGPVWWPGIVCNNEEVPPEILKNLRKTPIAIVKFFQEDSFEYVKKLTNIYHYNCLKKNEFIKKGLDMGRSKNRDTPSNMKLFPEDVARAEVLTGGNPNILHDEMFQPEEKPAYADLFSTGKKPPKKIKPDIKKKTPQPVPQNTPRIITHPRFIKLSSGIETDYEARERKQEPLRAECDEEDNSPPTTYRCSDCDFTTIRLNVIVLHNKSHTRNYASPVTGKATKRKSTSLKFKERMSNEWKSSETEPVKAKIPKTNGTFVKRSPKTPGRKKATAEKGVSKSATKEPEKKTEPSIEKQKRSMPQTDEFQESLLEDWAEYELAEQEALENDSISSQPSESNVSVENNAESHIHAESAPPSSAPPISAPAENAEAKEKNPVRIEEEKKKSCFDFDDSEDHIIIDKSKIKFGRKIPRVLDEKVEETKTHKLDHVNVKPAACNDVEMSSVYEKGVDAEYLSDPQNQSQLQEMGVDNEIEIKTEEVSSEDVTETLVDESVEKTFSDDAETVAKEKEAAELSEKVDQLLDEIAAPPKLPELPRSHKKDRLKMYCETVQNAVLEPTQETIDAPNQPVEQQNCSVSADTNVPSTNAVPIQNETEIEIKQTQPDARNEIESKVQTDVRSRLIDNIDSIESIEISSSPEQLSEEISASESKFIPIPAASAVNRTPLKMVTKRAPIRFTTMPQYKTINASQIFNTSSRTVKVIPKNLMISNSGTPSAQTQSSSMKTQSTMTFKTADGKSIICNVKPALLNKPVSTTVAATPPRQIGLTGPKVRLTPNILQKTSKNVAATASKPQTKVVLTSGTLQMLMQSQSKKPTTVLQTAPTTQEAEVVIPQSQSEFMFVPDDSKSFGITNANSSSQPLELNYIVDESGNLISLPNVDSATGSTSKKEDILAKALENTDVLQTEMALDASSIVIDSCNVAQNTSATYKTETVYENLTLNTPPIMSAYETPSRALSSTSIADIPNEMIIISGSSESAEYLA